MGPSKNICTSCMLVPVLTYLLYLQYDVNYSRTYKLHGSQLVVRVLDSICTIYLPVIFVLVYYGVYLCTIIFTYIYIYVFLRRCYFCCYVVGKKLFIVRYLNVEIDVYNQYSYLLLINQFITVMRKKLLFLYYVNQVFFFWSCLNLSS